MQGGVYPGWCNEALSIRHLQAPRVADGQGPGPGPGSCAIHHWTKVRGGWHRSLIHTRILPLQPGYMAGVAES